MVDVGAPARAPCNLHAIDMENMMFELRTEANNFAQKISRERTTSQHRCRCRSLVSRLSTLDHQPISVSTPYNAQCAEQAKLQSTHADGADDGD